MSNLRPSPHFIAIVASIEILRPVDEAWSIIGSYGDAGRFIDTASMLLSGHGEIGSVRQIGDGIVEVLIGLSRHAYTYAQIQGPMAPFTYHGCLDLRMETATTSRLLYTLSYDQADMDEARRQQEFDRITKRFNDVVKTMKLCAEGQA
ncbi:hypothetical protein [Rugamonas sp.]|uniref:hypothetical protein n=1 Tax=Rugamonas sp. TaxID=1926287 RepID=UPI0025F6DCF8|nr:hypothetical protein [Rugamonas sp.]